MWPEKSSWCDFWLQNFLLTFLTNENKEGHIQAQEAPQVSTLRLGELDAVTPQHHITAGTVTQHIISEVKLRSVVCFVGHFLGLCVWFPGGRLGFCSCGSIAAPGPWLVQLDCRSILKRRKEF